MALGREVGVSLFAHMRIGCRNHIGFDVVSFQSRLKLSESFIENIHGFFSFLRKTD